MSGNNGLFDSDDEDDIQYNPDETDDMGTAPTNSYPAPDPVQVPVAASPNMVAPAGNPLEEEKTHATSYPSAGPPTAPMPTPAPVVATAPTQVPVPTPAPVDQVPVPAPTPVDDIESIFTVTDPVHAGHVSYTIKGRDEDGDFEGQRRYNDFYHLRNALINRWPGTFIPAIPAKKAVGNKDDKYIEHRRHFLQRFLRKVANLPHILN